MLGAGVDNDNFVVPLPPAKVAYIYDPCLAKSTNKISPIVGRSEMVHELIKSYGLLKFMELKESTKATWEDLTKFHSHDYLVFLVRAGKSSNFSEGDEDDGLDEHNSAETPLQYGVNLQVKFHEEYLDDFGLGYDCPIFKDMEQFVYSIAGGTMTAADALVDGADVAINWCGGWHHAQRSEASGFCYVNDIVLGIHTLQKKFNHVLYIDLDSHHGDGVENAFAFSDKVFTLSFHHYERGYFPGTGNINDVGNGRGKYYSLNVPLKMGVTDSQFIFLFDSIIESVHRNFSPEAIVVQCGADCLAKDPLGTFNLTLKSIVHCVEAIFKLGKFKRIPTLLLGGGGYNKANAAKLWTRLTAEAVGRKIKTDIPDNSFFLEYGPDFELRIEPSLRKNENDDEYISNVIQTVMNHLLCLKERKKPKI